MARIEVVAYRPEWPVQFEALRATLWPAVGPYALSIEHVGSTSVPGLSAKPILDIDIVIESANALPPIIEGLIPLGYTHRGDLGIVGREAFAAPPDTVPHHLYVCLDGCMSLRNHLLLRDRLRRDADARTRYGNLKQQLGLRHADNIDAYCAAKTDLILELLADEGVPDDDRAAIRAANA